MRRTTSTYIAVTIAVVTAALFVAIPFASAHEFGSSFEAEIEDGMIDIGYSVEEFTDDTSVIFDFEVVDANKDEIPFTDVWVRLVRDKSTVLATGVHNADLGGSLLTYKFPSAGEYVLHARFQNNGDKVAEAEFPLMVQRGVTTRNGGSGALYAGMGFVGGMLLSIVPFCLRDEKTTNMRRWVVVGVIVTALVAVALYAFFIRERGNYFASAVTDAPQEATITLTDSGFVPRETTIRQGGTITFTNDTAKPFWPASNLHPSHQLYSEFDPLRPLSVDETWSFTFERLGTHNFHDHLRSYFVGKIHVVE